MLVYSTPKPALLTAITILDEAFTGYALVSAKVPRTERPDRFVRVTRMGGGLKHIASDAARILVECYAKEVSQVEAMCNTARTALRNAGGTTVTTTSGDVFVRAWEGEQGPTDFPNPEVVDYERWQLFGQLVIKAN